MMRVVLSLLLITGACSSAQESQLGAEFRHEKEDVQASCSGPFFKSFFGCGQTLFTDDPLHIAIGSIAPQNGFAVGPAFVTHYTPNERWRLSWDADAVASKNASWRAGVYMKAVYIPREKISVTTSTSGQPPKSNLAVREYPIINVYAQSISLNTIDYYGLGNSTSVNGESVFGMRETIAGASAIVPVIRRLKLSVFGEVNGRFVDIRPDLGESTPSIDQLYNLSLRNGIESPVPGLNSQPGFLQLGQGIRVRPAFLSDHIELNYQATLQEFIAPGSGYSFNRFIADLAHDFPIYGNLSLFRPRDFNGPDQCASSPGAKCPAIARNRSGTFSARLLISESFTSADNAVPFYFQPTLGGSDIDGNQFLASYRDYRFRAPNVLLFRGSFEHSIWGPLGFMFLADEGKVALTHSQLDFSHLKHTFSAGLTLRAGGFPAVSFLFAWGGTEGTHTIMSVNTSLLGGSARPSLF